jgi:hypothetical protein
VVKRPGDEAARQRLKAHGGGELQCERGGKEGGVGCGEVRRGWAPFIGAEGEGGEVNAAPVMAVHADYWKRRRWRRPIKEG